VSEADAEQAVEVSSVRLPGWSFSPGFAPIARAATMLRATLPLRRGLFETHLKALLSQTDSSARNFYFGGFPGRRALGDQLVIEIDPRILRLRLMQRIQSSSGRLYIHDKFIGAGSWRGIVHPVARSSTHRDVLEIVRQDFDYRNTAAYRSAMSRARTRKPIRRNFIELKSPQLVEGYFRHTSDLCRSVRESGVRRRSEWHQGIFANPRVRLPWVEWMEADIGIAIGRDGGIFHFGSGKHRTAAAQALGVKSIPAEVRMVHLEWLRSQMAKTGLAPVQALLKGIEELARQYR